MHPKNTEQHTETLTAQWAKTIEPVQKNTTAADWLKATAETEKDGDPGMKRLMRHLWATLPEKDQQETEKQYRRLLDN
jgi:uncharacterized protein YndB with AHSA1/START domain